MNKKRKLAKKQRSAKTRRIIVGATYDGEKFVLDEPLDLPPNTPIRLKIARKWLAQNEQKKMRAPFSPPTAPEAMADVEQLNGENLAPRQPFSDQEIEDIARSMVRDHFETEEFLERIVWFKNAADKEEIHLIEVNRECPPLGAVMPLFFGATEKFPLDALVADVSPEDWEQIRAGTMRLLPGWSLENAVEFEREATLAHE